MIEKLNEHWSFTTPASVHDEEALTALELAGRLIKKTNEVIEYVNNSVDKQNEFINKMYDRVPSDVSKWLDEHPEVTTTIQNGEIVEDKLHDSLKIKVVKDYVTPQMFGAKGDGVTDDTEAIQRALNYLETAKEHTLFFPAGTYCVAGNGSIFNSKFVSLVGTGSSRIYVTAGDRYTNLFTFTGTTQNFNGIITGLEFDYKANNFTMINTVLKFVFEKPSDILFNMSISNNLFRKNIGYKIVTEGSGTDVGFNNCKFSNNTVYGLFMSSDSFGDSNKIIGNNLFGSEDILLTDYVIKLTQTPGSSGCEVAGNNCMSGLGYFDSFANLNLYSNQVENTTQTKIDYALKISHGTNITIDSCNFNAHYKSNLIYSDAANTVVRNCTLWGMIDCAINNGNYHLTVVENVKFSPDGATTYYQIHGAYVNGYVTNTLYNTDTAKYWIDNSLTLNFIPKVTNSIPIAPLQCAVESNDYVYIPVETIGDTVKSIRVQNKNYLYTDTLFNVPARIPIKMF